MADTDVLRIPVDTRQVDQGTTSLNRLDRAGDRVDTTFNNLNRSTGAFGRTMGRTLGVLATAGAALALIGKSVDDFRKFEKALVGVGKTANIAGEELTVFGESIQQLSKEIPVATDELLTIAQTAGQLGIKGSRNIRTFTTVIAKLGRSSNLAGEEAATALARLLTVTSENITEAGRLASQIVSLGNNFAATEAEIAKTAGEIARATAVFGIGSGAAVAFSATLSQIGVQSELSGSAIGRTFRAIDKAVRTGGEKLDALSKIIGKTGEEITESFGRDKVATFQDFLRGLEAIAKSGGDTTAALATMKLKGEEILKVIPSLALSSDELAKAIGLVKDEADRPSALDNEFARSMETLDTELQLLSNSFKVITQLIGKQFAPVIIESSKAIREFFDSFDDNKSSLDTNVDIIIRLQEEISNIRDGMDAVTRASQTFGGGFVNASSSLVDSQGRIDVLTQSILKLNEELIKEALLNNKTQISLEDIAEPTNVLTEKKAKLNTQYKWERAFLSTIIPKMTAFHKEQSRLTETQEKANTVLSRQVEEIGLTKSELENLTITRAEEALELARSTGATEEYSTSLQKQINILRKRKTAGKAFEAEKKAIKENNKLLTTLEGHGRTVFKSIFDSGKNTFENLTKILKETLIEALFQLTLKKWIVNIATNIVGGTGIGGTAIGGGAGGGIGGIGNVITSGVDVFTGCGGVAGSLITSQIGSQLGLSTAISGPVPLGGTSLGFAPTTLGLGIGGAVTGGALGAGIASLTGGDPTGGAIGGAVAGIGAALAGFTGGLSLLISGLGGLLGGKLFGGGEPEEPRFRALTTLRPGGGTTFGEVTTSIPLIDGERPGVVAKRIAQAQFESLEKLMDATGIFFGDLNKDVLLFNANLLNATEASLNAEFFQSVGELISMGVLEGVPTSLAKSIEDASGGVEIQQAVDSWLAAKDVLQRLLGSLVEAGQSSIPITEESLQTINEQFNILAENAGEFGLSLKPITNIFDTTRDRSLDIVSNQFDLLSEKSEEFGLSLETITDAYANITNNLEIQTSDFIDNINIEIQKLSDPNGAALTALRKWRDEAIKEVESLGAGTAEVMELFTLRQNKLLADQALIAEPELDGQLENLGAEFIDNINTTIQELSDPNGAALTALRKWRDKAIQEAESLGVGTIGVLQLFSIRQKALIVEQAQEKEQEREQELQNQERHMEQLAKERQRVVSTSLSSLRKSISSERNLIKSAANDIETSLSATRITLSTLSNAMESLSDTSVDTTSLESATNLLESAIEFSKTGVDISTFEGLEKAINTMTNIEENLFSSVVSFERARGQSRGLIQTLITETENQLTTEEMTLESMQESLNRLDSILQKSQEQVDILREVDTSIKSVSNALTTLGFAVSSAGGTFNIPSFATGTNVVPFDTVAQVHKGERIIPAADNRQLMRNIGNEQTIVKEINAMRKDLAALMTPIALNTGRVRRITERHDSEGVPPQRIPA